MLGEKMLAKKLITYVCLANTKYNIFYSIPMYKKRIGTACTYFEFKVYLNLHRNRIKILNYNIGNVNCNKNVYPKR